MINKAYILATDLDGTLVGDKEELQKLMRYFNESINDVAFIYITGRHLNSALSLIKNEALPMPDVLITDVGTCIYKTNNLMEDKLWKEKMESDWQPNLIEELASAIPEISKQSLPVNCRVSFTTEGDDIAVNELEKNLNRHKVAHKMIYSSNRDVDVLPKYSGKGQALTYVLNKYGSSDANILVAGDSGNDLEMLSLGYPSVIVGNAQNELTSSKLHPKTYRATKEYAGGIHEAWIHFFET